MEQKTRKPLKQIVALIYIVFICFFVFKGLHYMKYVQYVPDEHTHLSYVIYMKENPYKFIPDFEEIRYSYMKSSDDDNLYIAEGETCQLGHAPLYYSIMAAFGDIEILEEGESARVNMVQLRMLNLILATLGMLLFCYIGFSRIDSNIDNITNHIFYAATSTGIPMIALSSAGVTNDNLIYIGFGLFLLGIIRYFEDKDDLGTYILVAIGFFVCMMSKLTAGFAVCVALLMILVFDWIYNKKPRVLCNKSFILSLPIYLITLVYFASVFVKYKTIQPTLSILNPEQYYNSGWYIPMENRVELSFREYLKTFLDTMGYTWTSIYNGEFFYFKKAGIFEWWPFVLIVIVAIIYLIYHLISLFVKKERINIWLVACIVGGIAMLVQNYVTCYNNFLSSGRVGGIQGRYYMFLAPILALANIYLISEFKRGKWSKTIVNILIMLYAIWIVYSDFFYNINRFGYELVSKI